jgi:hypothetical protein
MITYEITAVVRDDLAERYERYMRGRHVPDLLATGWFSGASFSRSAPGRYRVRYEAIDRESLDRYLGDNAATLRRHFLETFPEGVSLEREEWEVLERW